MTRLTPEQIDAAEAAGIIPPKQAKAMRADLAADDPSRTTAPSEPTIGDEDNLRFLRSFGDVFIGVGLVLLALGVSAVVGLFGGGAVFLLAAAGAFGLAEYFGHHKRAHFPTLITALAFLIFVQAGLSGITAIAAGYHHSLALKDDGTVVGWGDNYYGQATPPAGLSGVTAIAAGSYHSLALKVAAP